MVDVKRKNSILSKVEPPNVPGRSNEFAVAKSLQEVAASVGFDWSEVDPVFAKLHEEIDELREEVSNLAEATSPQDRLLAKEKVAKEFGDLLFVCVNLSRFLKVECEDSLALTNNKFRQRFQYIESELLNTGLDFNEVTLEYLDTLWERSKSQTP